MTSDLTIRSSRDPLRRSTHYHAQRGDGVQVEVELTDIVQYRWREQEDLVLVALRNRFQELDPNPICPQCWYPTESNPEWATEDEGFPTYCPHCDC